MKVIYYREDDKYERQKEETQHWHKLCWIENMKQKKNAKMSQGRKLSWHKKRWGNKH